MAKPLSKSKIVAHIAEKVGTPKKTAVLFFEELFKLAVRECKGGAGTVSYTHLTLPTIYSV